jgi:hypothetical protein
VSKFKVDVAESRENSIISAATENLLQLASLHMVIQKNYPIDVYLYKAACCCIQANKASVE